MKTARSITTILVTGFGPFPGAPFNPTVPLVKRLARLRRPGLADMAVVSHVFATSYASVDRELPRLIATHKPAALLMFGLATRAKKLRVETRARNTTAIMPDAGGVSPRGHAVADNGPSALALPVPAQRLLAALRMARVPAALSHDAGTYLCNYLCWRAADIAQRPGGPRLAAFVHIPNMRRRRRSRGAKTYVSFDDLKRAGESLLITVAAATRS